MDCGVSSFLLSVCLGSIKHYWNLEETFLFLLSGSLIREQEEHMQHLPCHSSLTHCKAV